MAKPVGMSETNDNTRAEATFLATASHEIRTPLNGILGTVSLLLETELSPAQREYAEAIHNSGARLLDLLNNVLDHARLDAGEMALETEDFCPVGLAREVVELLSPRAHAQGLDIASRALHLPAAARRGDAGRIRQILFNLVGNALKFTEKGGVLVDIMPGPHDVTYRIIDTGPGIAPDERARLFEAFRQSRAADAQKDGGVGLGLSIVRRLTDLLGGEIEIFGAPGLGTMFTVTLPLTISDRAPAHDLPDLGASVALAGLPPASMLAATASLVDANARPVAIDPGDISAARKCSAILVGAELPEVQIVALAGAAPTLVVLRPEDRGAIARFRALGCMGWLVRPMRASSLVQRVYLAQTGAAGEVADSGIDARGARVLIADDNPVNALIARRALESAGFAVTVAATGVEALEAAETMSPDLVLMDLRMPVMDGLEATRRLRASGRTTPIIAISAEINPQVEADARRAGANQVAAKPIDPETLRRLAIKWTTAHVKQGAA